MRLWTTHERKAAQARAFAEQREYILPIRLDQTEIPGILPTLAYLSWHNNIGEVLQGLRRYKEALAAFERAIQLYRVNDQYYVYDVYCSKGETLTSLERYNEALTTYEHAIQLIQLDQANTNLYHLDNRALCGKGDILCDLERYDEALVVYEQIIQPEGDSTRRYYLCEALCGKGNVFYGLERYEEALAVCDQAIQLDPEDVNVYDTKGDALEALERHEEALQAYEMAKRFSDNK